LVHNANGVISVFFFWKEQEEERGMGIDQGKPLHPQVEPLNIIT
jgi:hypothetical protein